MRRVYDLTLLTVPSVLMYTFTSVSNLPAFTCTPKPSTKRMQVFGYALRSDWIVDFGQEHNVDPSSEKDECSLLVGTVELIRKEINKDGEFALVRYGTNTPDDIPAQIYVARNFSLPMKGSTTEPLILARVARLKKFLDTIEEPQWMNL